ncbi:hypothetical protein CDAR_67671 [Caerostris darwini]|uniref:Uncharacterized protein n=1 Tax=Caerostris darwini TaxID=1538125 RepID=A0AAV4TCX8_9ARAC|nr:hypothetical protein CDAR_67671 [Caerostris darwini]
MLFIYGYNNRKPTEPNCFEAGGEVTVMNYGNPKVKEHFLHLEQFRDTPARTTLIEADFCTSVNIMSHMYNMQCPSVEEGERRQAFTRLPLVRDFIKYGFFLSLTGHQAVFIFFKMPPINTNKQP